MKKLKKVYLVVCKNIVISRDFVKIMGIHESRELAENARRTLWELHAEVTEIQEFVVFR